MSVFAFFDPKVFNADAPARTSPTPKPKQDWPLMGDVASFRGDIPEALINWRKARGEAPPNPRILGKK
ncbi:hypothetical protein N9L47_05425 [Rhodobacteraceae bacterium]|nr:hypothetical protein [Paracoccaceae bacterium]